MPELTVMKEGRRWIVVDEAGEVVASAGTKHEAQDKAEALSEAPKTYPRWPY